MKYSIAIATIALALAGCASHDSLHGYHAKITQAQAEAIALKKTHGGKVQEAELEKEHGKVVWSIEIARAKSRNITEVHVDANTGQVVGTEIETPEHEAAEHAAEKKSH